MTSELNWFFQITGGSNGIGREICIELAKCGVNIACLDLDIGAAQQLCEELKNDYGIRASAYKVRRFVDFFSALTQLN